MEHGGDWAGYQMEYGALPLDFSSNVSPLGLPERARQAALEALARAERYPDPLCRALRGKLAERHGVPDTWILCGGGAADLIWRLAPAARPRTALVTAPTFSEYEKALALWGCRISRFPLSPETDFAVTSDILPSITEDLDLLFLCEPNNPTGRVTDRALLREILDRCAGTGTLVVVDECFTAFLDDPHTLVPCLSTHPNLLILRAFTKSFGMAGLRLGYALCADGALVEGMARSGPPWAVSGPAQAAGLAALEDTAYPEALRALIRSQRPRLATGLTALGCHVVPSDANYLLFRCGVPELSQKLRSRGILLRSCANYHGLDDAWYRAAVRTGQENDRFLHELKEVL